MDSLLVNKIINITNSLNYDDQEKVLAHAKKILAARRIEAAYTADFVPFEMSDEAIEQELKSLRNEKRNKQTGN